MEDALVAQCRQSVQALQQVEQLGATVKQMETFLGAAIEDNKAANTLLTDPEHLANYVNEFFGPEGPYPVETPRDRLAQDLAANGYLPGADGRMTSPQEARAYRRPTMDMPAPGVQSTPTGDAKQFWEEFHRVAREKPEMTYMLLDQARPEYFRARTFVSEVN